MQGCNYIKGYQKKKIKMGWSRLGESKSAATR